MMNEKEVGMAATAHELKRLREELDADIEMREADTEIDEESVAPTEVDDEMVVDVPEEPVARTSNVFGVELSGIEYEQLKLLHGLIDEEIQRRESRRDVYIATKQRNGPWAKPPFKHISIDVTSGQRKASQFRRDFSPMHISERKYEGGDGDYACYEHYWQSMKKIEGVDFEKAKAFWKGATSASGKRVLGAMHPSFPGRLLGVIESRKLAYIPEYAEKIKGTESLIKLRDLLHRGGHPLVVFDYDGPKTNGGPSYEKVTMETLRSKVDDGTAPFGHGYVVAACVLGLSLQELCAP